MGGEEEEGVEGFGEEEVGGQDYLLAVVEF